jgi:hypothetical protein
MLLKLVLACVYPVIVIGRVLNSVTGRDPLRRREPAGDSFWIPRRERASPAEYFQESSSVEGSGHGGFGGPALAILRRLGRFTAPRRLQPGERYSAAADREQGIPDEIYTLW